MKKTLLVALATCLLLAVGVARAANTCTFTENTNRAVMTLDGDCTTDEAIMIPDGWTLDGDGYTITAVGPIFKGAVLRNAGATAHVTNITLTAVGLPCTCHSGNDRIRGVLFDGAGGSITDTTITDMNQGNCGCQEGNGIEVRNLPFDGTHPNTVTVLIRGNVVTDYQKNGITANGDVIALVDDNTTDGMGQVPFIAQNGTQFGYGATGKIRNNVIDGNWYTGANWSSTGILIFEASDVVVLNNTVRDNQVGMTAEAWGWQNGSSDNNRFVNNTVEESNWGIVIDALAWAYSSMNCSASRNEVTGNKIVNRLGVGDTGIYLGTYDDNPTFDATVDSNTVRGNQIGGFTNPIVDDGTNTVVQGNRAFTP